MLKVKLFINNQSANKVLFEGNELDLIEFLNYILKNEFLFKKSVEEISAYNSINNT